MLGGIPQECERLRGEIKRNGEKKCVPIQRSCPLQSMRDNLSSFTGYSAPPHRLYLGGVKGVSMGGKYGWEGWEEGEMIKQRERKGIKNY